MEELEALIRQSISEEQKAVTDYLNRKVLCEQLAQQADTQDIADKLNTIAYTLNDILEEEKVHIGQLEAMLPMLGVDPSKELEGAQEGQEDIDKFTSFKDMTLEIDSLL